MPLDTSLNVFLPFVFLNRCTLELKRDKGIWSPNEQDPMMYVCLNQPHPGISHIHPNFFYIRHQATHRSINKELIKQLIP